MDTLILLLRRDPPLKRGLFEWCCNGRNLSGLSGSPVHGMTAGAPHQRGERWDGEAGAYVHGDFRVKPTGGRRTDGSSQCRVERHHVRSCYLDVVVRSCPRSRSVPLSGIAAPELDGGVGRLHLTESCYLPGIAACPRSPSAVLRSSARGSGAEPSITCCTGTGLP